MYRVEVHHRIEQIISTFHFIGLWHDRDDHTQNKRLKWTKTISQLIVYGYYPISLLLGALTCGNDTEAIFLFVLSIVAVILTVRLFYFAFGKDKILTFIRTVGVHEIKDCAKEFHRVTNRVNVFARFVTYFEAMLLVAVVAMISLPIFSSEKHFPLNIYFPLDWKSNEFYYWFIYLLVSYDLVMTIVYSFFNVIIWYLLMAFVLEYEILGTEFRNMGIATKAGKSASSTSHKEEAVSFLKDFISLIQQHKSLQMETLRFESFFANLFFIQIATSSVGICGSVFALAFVSNIAPSTVENPLQYGVYVIALLYNFFDIFMITYFANEIMLASGSLSYCLFGCNWMHQSEPAKKCIFILMEVLKRPEQLVVGKLYPLNLEIFTNIMNFAYRLFNILKNI